MQVREPLIIFSADKSTAYLMITAYAMITSRLTFGPPSSNPICWLDTGATPTTLLSPFSFGARSTDSPLSIIQAYEEFCRIYNIAECIYKSYASVTLPPLPLVDEQIISKPSPLSKAKLQIAVGVTVTVSVLLMALLALILIRRYREPKWVRRTDVSNFQTTSRTGMMFKPQMDAEDTAKHELEPQELRPKMDGKDGRVEIEGWDNQAFTPEMGRGPISLSRQELRGEEHSQVLGDFIG